MFGWLKSSPQAPGAVHQAPPKVSVVRQFAVGNRFTIPCPTCVNDVVRGYDADSNTFELFAGAMLAPGSQVEVINTTAPIGLMFRYHHLAGSRPDLASVTCPDGGYFFRRPELIDWPEVTAEIAN